MISRTQRLLAFGVVVLATILGFAATDLVLPAVPLLPRALDGTPAQAQHVLASFTAGLECGLLLFGELGARCAQRPLVILAILSSTAAGTVAVAPWITLGLVPAAAVASALSLGSVAVLIGLRLHEAPGIAR